MFDLIAIDNTLTEQRFPIGTDLTLRISKNATRCYAKQGF